MKRPLLMILQMAKIKKVNTKHPINTKQAVLVTPSANNFSLASISGMGLGVGVVGGGTVLKKYNVHSIVVCEIIDFIIYSLIPHI